LVTIIPADLGDDVARFGRVFGEMHFASDCLQPLCELLDKLRQAIQVGPTPLLQIFAALVEVEALESRVAARAEARHGLDESALQVRVGERLVDPAREVTPTFRHASCWLLESLP